MEEEWEGEQQPHTVDNHSTNIHLGATYVTNFSSANVQNSAVHPVISLSQPNQYATQPKEID
jgi:hypothetical protein